MNQYTRHQHTPREPKSRELKIYQYNVHRSKDVVMAQFLREEEVVSADLIAIQEPWENPYQDSTHHPLKQTHELLYPAESETGGRARVCLFISKRLGEHTHLVHSRDCQEVRIKSERSELRIINVYNDQQHGAALRLLQETLPPTREQKGVSYLILGDFNLHHPAWGGDDAPRDARAEDLLDLMESVGLDNWLAPGSVTRDQAGSQSTIDLVLASYSLREQMIACEVKTTTQAPNRILEISQEPRQLATSKQRQIQFNSLRYILIPVSKL